MPGARAFCRHVLRVGSLRSAALCCRLASRSATSRGVVGVPASPPPPALSLSDIITRPPVRGPSLGGQTRQDHQCALAAAAHARSNEFFILHRRQYARASPATLNDQGTEAGRAMHRQNTYGRWGACRGRRGGVWWCGVWGVVGQGGGGALGGRNGQHARRSPGGVWRSAMPVVVRPPHGTARCNAQRHVRHGAY